MISLAEWANFKKSNIDGGAFADGLDEANLAMHETGCDLPELMVALLDNVQIANRHSQAMHDQSQMPAGFERVADAVCRSLQDHLSKLGSVVDRQLNALFSPFLHQKLQHKAIEDFCDGLSKAIGKTATKLVVSVPAELHEPLVAKLAAANIEASIVVSEGPEISTSYDVTEFTTEIGKWKTELQRLIT